MKSVEYKPGKVEIKPVSTRDHIATTAKISVRSANDRLHDLKELGLIEPDITKSYQVSNKSEKAFKWVYRLTQDGLDRSFGKR